MATRRPPLPPPVEPKVFTIPEIDGGIRKLRRRIEEVQGLASNRLRYDDARVDTAEANIRESLREVFGTNSPEFQDHQHDRIWHGGYNVNDDDADRQEKFTRGIEQTVLMLEGLIARLEEKRADLAEGQPTPPAVPTATTQKSSRRVFIVHGHDEEAKQTVARFLERLKLEPVILSERPNEGRTIIEKFEVNSDVSYAVVLLTPDDFGYPRDQSDQPRPRARQNVILELGYFVGRLSRARVCALHKGSTEIPSDIHGVLYVTMDEAGGWKLRLASELKHAGLDVDLNLAV